MNRILSWSLVIGLFLAACRRPEKPWPLPPASSHRFLQAHAGPEYDTVLFVRFETGELHRVLRTAWDLELRPNPTRGLYEVWLNAAMYAFALPLSDSLWQSVQAPPQDGWRCDLADTAALPPLAPGERRYFLLDRDRAEAFYKTPDQRYRKIALYWEEGRLRLTAYTLTNDLVGEMVLSLPTQPVHFSLEGGLRQVAVEPPWTPDLILTRYIHPFYDQPEQFRWYPVLGALIGPQTEVAIVSAAEKPFEEFTYADAAARSYTSRRDAIGYDWKRYDFNTGTYTLDFSRYFVLRTSPTSYYKLRFTDFYDTQGRKGCVQIEYSPL
ncbi:MAG: hypothetical protein KatS3mg026_0865 [Bacteroidia bacterium]|nr:MAG: hypothetical protein KatS3mg026_0865 [Bacteroidia bacterium]